MSNPSKSSDVTFPHAPASFARRAIASNPMAHVTCLVLVKHHETEKALLVSDNGDAVGAVWVPKSMLWLDQADRGRFIVATMSKGFAEQKRLYPRFIDPARFLAEEIASLREAEGLAARTRNRLRGHRDPLPYPGRNAFA